VLVDLASARSRLLDRHDHDGPEIRGYLEELCGIDVSPDLISTVTDAVLDEVAEWQNRPLDICYQAPVKAAVTAQLATAIAILTFDPVRLGNLIQIRLGENLIKPGKLEDPYWLVFPHYDVKNRVQLEVELPPEVCEIIDEYIHDYRSVLLRGSNEPWLFPGETGGVKTSRTLSLQITARIEKACGLRDVGVG
jgi:integrase